MNSLLGQIAKAVLASFLPVEETQGENPIVMLTLRNVYQHDLQIKPDRISFYRNGIEYDYELGVEIKNAGENVAVHVSYFNEEDDLDRNDNLSFEKTFIYDNPMFALHAAIFILANDFNHELEMPNEPLEIITQSPESDFDPLDEELRLMMEDSNKENDEGEVSIWCITLEETRSQRVIEILELGSSIESDKNPLDEFTKAILSLSAYEMQSRIERHTDIEFTLEDSRLEVLNTLYQYLVDESLKELPKSKLKWPRWFS